LAPIAATLMVLATAQAQPAIDWSSSEPISVVMVDDNFVPERLTLQHGTAYALYLENRGTDLHEFTAPEFFADTVLRDPDLLANGGAEVVLQPGQGVVIYLMPVAAGTFRLTCADHDWDGMVGEIAVE
jgi:uncharacterized cupredoxin-like copper-binding protein